MTDAGTRPPSVGCAVIELRQYATRPDGGRDELIELFERELVETQEAHGMAVLGEFRDLDNANRFVWLRGFADMASRHAGLAGFYGGPVWAAHAAAANATMEDSDDVLLLRPMFADTGIEPPASPRPPVGSTRPGALIVITIWPLPHAPSPALRAFFRHPVDAVLSTAGSARLALLETEESPNTFPGLPVREGEHVIVRIARFADLAAYDAHCAQLATSSEGRALTTAVAEHGAGTPVTLRLDPAPRSLLR